MMQPTASWTSIGAFQGSWMYWKGKLVSSGTYLRIKSPEGSRRLPYETELMQTEQSSSRSKAELDTHIQLPALIDQSQSTRCSAMWSAPFSQWSHRSPRVRNMATAFRTLQNKKSSSFLKLFSWCSF